MESDGIKADDHYLSPLSDSKTDEKLMEFGRAVI